MTRVVVSVGTDHHPFDRMLDWIEIAQRRLDIDAVVQRGATESRSGIESMDYVTADELADLMRTADAVVCHGGPGTISLAQRSGHRPIVVARDPTLGEHVDDHQQRYASKLAAEDHIDTAGSADELVALLAAPRPPSSRAGNDEEADRAVSQFSDLIGRLLEGTLPKRRWRDRVLIRRTR